MSSKSIKNNGNMSSKSINNNINRMFVCRHSERIDEASKSEYQLWLESIDTMTNTTRPINDIKKDPIITPRGKLFAQTLGLTLSRITELQDVTCMIYCSRLKRCIQTAYEVAKILNLPVYVSTGLSQTAKAIEELDNKNGFQFMPIEEIKETYNEVQWFCCDQSYDQNGVKLLADGVFTDCPQVPWQDWSSPLKYIAQNNKISIVVAHRETIRKLVGSKVATPYCCMGIFDYDSNPKNNTRKNEFRYIETRTREGQVIR